MEPTINSLRYRMVGQDALIIMKNGKSCQPVQISRDALTNIQSPPRCDAARLAQYLEVFAQIAIRKIQAEKVAFDGRIWITGDDVRAWRSLNGSEPRETDGD